MSSMNHFDSNTFDDSQPYASEKNYGFRNNAYKNKKDTAADDNIIGITASKVKFLKGNDYLRTSQQRLSAQAKLVNFTEENDPKDNSFSVFDTQRCIDSGRRYGNKIGLDLSNELNGGKPGSH